MIDTYFAGWKPEPSNPIEGEGFRLTTCRFKDKNRRATIEYRCGDNFKDFDRYVKLLQETHTHAKVERFDGIGARAYRLGDREVGARHRNRPCVIAVGRDPMDDSWMDFVKALEAAAPD